MAANEETINGYKITKDSGWFRIGNAKGQSLLSCAYSPLQGCCSGYLINSMSIIPDSAKNVDESLNELMYLLEYNFRSMSLLLYVYSTIFNNKLEKAFTIRKWKRMEGLPGSYITTQGPYTLDIFICNPKFSKLIYTEEVKEKKTIKKSIRKAVKKVKKND